MSEYCSTSPLRKSARPCGTLRPARKILPDLESRVNPGQVNNPGPWWANLGRIRVGKVQLFLSPYQICLKKSRIVSRSKHVWTIYIDSQSGRNPGSIAGI